MLKSKQHSELLLSDWPPVFGKPWFWQHGSSTKDSTRSLAHVIMEMRDEIKKLGAENRQLTETCGQRTCVAGAGGNSRAEQRAEAEENLYMNLRRNASAPVLKGQRKEKTVMTVRRYSTNCSLAGVTMKDDGSDGTQQNNSGWGRLQEIQQKNRTFGNSSRGEEEKVTNRHSLQEYVHKNRTKVKTVTFLLPVDDIYTNRPVLPKHQGEPKIRELASITETDS